MSWMKYTKSCTWDLEKSGNENHDNGEWIAICSPFHERKIYAHCTHTPSAY